MGQDRAEEKKSQRSNERQLPVRGPVDDEPERDRRQDRGQRGACVHHPRSGARELPRDVHRDRPHRPDHELGEEECRAERQDDQDEVVGEEDRQQADE